MKFTFRPSPNVRERQSTQKIMFELSIALLVVFAFGLAFYYVEYGTSYAIHALLLLITAVGISVLSEVLWCLILKKDIKKHLQGSFPWVTGLILVLMVPISMTYYALGFGAFFAIFFVKLLFGGFGHNIFNPAAAGRAAILTSFAGRVAADVTTGATPITSMSQMGWLITDQSLLTPFLNQFGGLWGLFVGWYPGALGETSAVLIVVIGVILAFRRVLDWKVPVFYVGTVFVLASVIALIRGTGIWYPLYHVLAGGLLFGAVFMATDPVTNPTSATGRIVFAIGLGILTILIRVQANLPGGVLYAILIMNVFTPTIERMTDGWQIAKMKKYAISALSLGTIGVILMAFVATIITPIVPKEEPVKPSITLGSSIKVFSLETARAPAEILETSTVGDSVLYTIASKGYAVLEAAYEGAEANVFEVSLNSNLNQVVYVKIIKNNDTPGIGDIIDDEIFLEQFEGLALDDDEISVDTVSGSTVTSVSAVRALRAAIEAERKGD